MRVDNTAFAGRNQATAKVIKRVVEIEFGPANILTLTSDASQVWSTGTVKAGFLKKVNSTSQKLDPVTARMTIGTLLVDCIDKDGEITVFLRNEQNAGRGIRHAKIRYYIGYEGLAQADYVLRATQIIDKVEFNGGVYTFGAAEITREARKQIFEPKQTTISATVGIDDTTINVADTSAFELIAHGTSYSDSPSATVGYIKIKDEIIRYTGKTATSFTGCTRGALFTTPEVYEVGNESQDRRETVTEYIYIELPAPKMIYALLTGDIHNTANTLPAHWHLGIDPADINLTQFLTIDIDLWNPGDDAQGFVIRFSDPGRTDGKRFIEQEILRLSSLFMPIYSDGRIGLRRRANIGQDAPYQKLLDENLVTKVSGLKHDTTQVSNVYRIDWNHNGERFTRSNTLIDSDSISVFGQTPTKVLRFRGLHGTRHTTSVVQSQIDALRDAFSGPPEICRVTCLHSLNNIEVGDIVRLRLPHVQDYQGASTSIDRSFEVHSVKLDDASGNVSLDLFGSTRKALAQSDPDSTAGGDLPDAFYTSEGTNITTALATTGTDPIVISGNQTLTGAADMNAAASIFYANSNLELAAGATLTIVGNVQIRVKGFFDVRGTIDGAGNGHAGVADPSPIDPYEIDTGTPGFLGSSKGSSGLKETVFVLDGQFGPGPIPTVTLIEPPITVGKNQVFPKLEVRYDSTDGLLGIPSDLQGTSGGHGGRCIGDANDLVAPGGTGGPSGAGLAVVCRGMDFAGAGAIDLSGGDAPVDNNDGILTATVYNSDVRAGFGGAGCAGAFLVLLDGSAAVYPSVSGRFTANFGDIPAPTGTFIVAPPTGETGQATISSFIYQGYETGIQNLQTWNDAHRVQFIPPPQTAEPDVPDTTTVALYYLKPTNGTAIKNGVGTLTVEARRVTANADTLISSGSIKIYDPADNEVTLANGYAAGSDGFTAVLDAGDITDSIVLTLKNGPSGTPLDTITLVDIADGNVTVGSVNASNGLSWTWDANAPAWSPATLTTDLVATFYFAGAPIATRTIRVTNDGTGVLTSSDLGGTGEATTYATSGESSGALTVEITHTASGALVAETALSVLGGVDGATGDPGPTGDPGDPGATWFTGTSDPNETVPAGAIVGDFFLNETTNEYFELTSTGPRVWTSRGNLSGESIYTATVYRRLATTPATPTTDDGQYDFTTKTLTPPALWSATPPDTDGNPLWGSSGTFAIQGTTGIDPSVTWSAPSKIVEDGADGEPGAPGAPGDPGDPGRDGVVVAGVKINVDSFSGPANTGEMYLHGFNAAGDPADVDGSLYYDGARITIPKQTIATQQHLGDGITGFLVFDTVASSFTVASSAVRTAACRISNPSVGEIQWQYDNNSAWVNFTPSADHLIIGYYLTSAADNILTASITAPIPTEAAVIQAGRITAAQLSAIAATIGSLETRLDTGGVGNTTPRLTLTNSAAPLQIFDEDDVTLLFGITDTGSEARLYLKGDFAAGSIGSGGMFSTAGIADLRDRLGLAAPGGGSTGGTVEATVPVNLTAAISTFQTINLSTGSPISSGGANVDLTFSINDSKFNSTSPITAGQWTLRWQVSVNGGAYSTITGSTFTLTGDVNTTIEDTIPPTTYYHYSLNETRDFVYTEAVNGNTYAFRLQARWDSGARYNARITAATGSEPVGNAGVASHTHDAADITSGTFADARIPSLAASKITSGTFADARIPSLATSKITSGTFADARISAGSVTQHLGKYLRHITTGYNGGTITVDTSAPVSPAQGDMWFDTAAGGFSEVNDLTASVTWANVPLANIPSLPASQITSGTLPVTRGGTGTTSSTGTGSVVRHTSPTFAGTANFANAKFTGANDQLTLEGVSPQMKFVDTTAASDDFWFHINGNNFYILADRTEAGTWQSPHPLQLEADTNNGYLFGSLIATKPGSGGVLGYVSSSYSGGKITVSTSAPGSPAQGDIWFDTT